MGNGWIVEVCGPDEWQVCVQDYALALTEGGQVPPSGIPEQDLLFPCCFRDSSEIRARCDQASLGPSGRGDTEARGAEDTPGQRERES